MRCPRCGKVRRVKPHVVKRNPFCRRCLKANP